MGRRVPLSITQFGALLLGYELVAKSTGLPTWTTLAGRRSVLALPIVVFACWLPLHLAGAR